MLTTLLFYGNPVVCFCTTPVLGPQFQDPSFFFFVCLFFYDSATYRTGLYSGGYGFKTAALGSRWFSYIVSRSTY